MSKCTSRRRGGPSAALGKAEGGGATPLRAENSDLQGKVTFDSMGILVSSKFAHKRAHPIFP